MVRSHGFTLVELLVVVSIISLLSSVSVASLNVAREKARLAAARSYASQLHRAIGDTAVGAWDFDECAGTSTADRSGFGHAAELKNGASFSPDSPSGVGCSLILDGTNDHAVVTGVVLESSAAVTFSYWLYIDTQPTNYRRMISDPGGGVDVYFTSTGSSGLYGVVGNSTSGWIMQGSDLRGVWNHIVVTGDATNGQVRSYLNGKLVTTRGASFTETVLDNIRFGSDGTGTNYFLQGKLDEIRVYSKILSAAEIGALYAQVRRGLGVAATF